MNRRTINIICLLILSVFAFHFLHSEFDLLLSEYDHDHYEHDYCHLVDSASVATFKYTPQDILKIIPAIIPAIFLLITAAGNEFHFNLADILAYRNTGKQLYLRNRILLI